WATLPEYIDTTDLLALALDEKVAFVPGEGAFVDGRGRSSMRLNFSGVGEDDIREGIRRIGQTVAAQVALWDAVSGTRRPPATPRAPRDAAPRDGAGSAPPAPGEAAAAALADVLELPRRVGGSREARRRPSP
ncbi:MAG TPA: PLP-dependent aminotransferase family protein, partial [Solirubrobacteraceae bacterium]|nr:PLP-dependent aminotransferase family protein [Solirubrobacteraceae bacterium]